MALFWNLLRDFISDLLGRGGQMMVVRSFNLNNSSNAPTAGTVTVPGDLHLILFPSPVNIGTIHG